MSASKATPFIPFFRPSLGREEERAVLSVMRSGWLTTGEVTALFEKEFARAVGTRHALALNSATAGLHLALEALGAGPDSVVITSPYTFAATAEVVRYLGADPLFVDIKRETLNMDPVALERGLEDCRRKGLSVSAVVPVHVAGLSCDMEAIRSRCAAFSVPIVEDAAHSSPVRPATGSGGSLGEAAVYSFYATKPITTGEGGMVATDREDIARRIRVMRLHGIDRDVWDRYTSRGAPWRYDIVAPGFKYNLTDLAAAIGRVQLAKAERFLQMRKRIARVYLEGLSGLDFLSLPAETEGHGWHLFIIMINEERLAIGRDGFIEELEQRGIGSSVHFIPLHLMSYYRERYRLRPEDFPVAFECSRSCISLPLFATLTEREAERVVEAVADIGAKHSR
jgi:dTDP-4-amino-4,6-dideoxygalactose transaminase